jgi:transcriptional regulator with XRE-family HTH domain
MKEKKIQIGEIIRNARLKKDLKHREILEMTGISQQMQSLYENDHAIPSRKAWEKLYPVLDLPYDLIYRIPDEETKYNFVKEEYYQQYLTLEPIVDDAYLIEMIKLIKGEKQFLINSEFSGFLKYVSSAKTEEKKFITESIKSYFNLIINQKNKSKKGH